MLRTPDNIDHQRRLQVRQCSAHFTIMIIFKDITKKYQDKTVLDNCSLDFPEKGFVCITGPSGIGKTTVFNLLLGLEQPDSGEVSVLSGSSLPVSVVFQEDRLLPGESVLNNVLIPALQNTPNIIMTNPVTIRENCIRILTELGLGNELDTMPSELSGGMSRRVSIARALAVDAQIYLMDEPTKGLDDATRANTLRVIRTYTDQAVSADGRPLNRLLIMITHNQEETEGAAVISLTR